MLTSGVSEMDASRLDPENRLVDLETVECEGEGDVILEIDRKMENSLDEEEGKRDKVAVSFRSMFFPSKYIPINN
jgi:hypothetical protein